MTKAAFVKLVAERMEVPSREVEEFINAFEETLKIDVISAEESVRLGLATISGTFKETKERSARNPRTGETIKVPAKKIHGFPKCKWSKNLTSKDSDED